MLAAAKFRAKQKDLPFNLTAEFLEKVCASGTCAYCAVPVTHGGIGRSLSAGELDRVDPALGYVRGNVLMACAQCNQRKSDMLPMQMRALADAIEAAIKMRVIQR